MTLEDRPIGLWARGWTEELVTRQASIQEMACLLDAFDDPRAMLAARSTRDVLIFIAAIERTSEKLGDIWTAMEQLDNGRTSRAEPLREALASFTPWPPPAEGESS